ncbi:hypothetical protein RCH21_000247 [Arthrobacter sp. PL16]|uniref:DUF2304 domain-containing protein n=1 Tax=Arthrobacter sp. PL16 TaxID=3071720 RepID=UPI002E08511D|nr:hypothetical protein [Arthrobacter sp. PL16]
MIAQIAPFAFALIMVGIVLEMLRRKTLREKYAVLWLVVGTGSLILGGFPRLLEVSSEVLGVEVPSNLLFAIGLVFLVGVCLHLSWELSLVEDETRVLAEEVALLRAAVEDLQSSNGTTVVRDGREGGNPQP